MEKFLNFCLWLVTVFVSGLCFAYIWRWFVTPLGIPAISVLHAIGLSFIPGVLTLKDPDKEVSTEKLLFTNFANLFSLLFAYIAHIAM